MRKLIGAFCALLLSSSLAYGQASVAVVDPNNVGHYAAPLADTTLPVVNGAGVAVSASATGTTTATNAALAATASKTNYVCGFSIRANATAAATGTATLSDGTWTLSFTQWTAPLASGIGVIEEQFNRCIPASSVNTAITATSAAPGAGGNVSVSIWGYRE